MKLHTQQDANDTLRKIGRLQRDIEAEEVLLNDGIENLKNISLQKVSPLCQERDEAEAVLLEYIKENKSEVAAGPTKSLTLPYGTIGVRDSQSVPRRKRGFTDDEVAKALMKGGFRDCVKIEYKWIKNAVKALDTALRPRLERFGILFSKVRKDQPFYTIDEAKIAEEA